MFSKQGDTSEMPSRTFIVRRDIERSDNDVGGDFYEPRTARATLH